MSIYLIKKTHKITGLMYLCKTVRKDWHIYSGSGKYWKDHLRIHGNAVDSELVRECKTDHELKWWGIYYSILWNIVDDNKWANLRQEDGNGWSSSTATEIQNRPSVKKKKSDSLLNFWENIDDDYKKQRSNNIKNSLDNSTTKTKILAARSKQIGLNAPKVDKTIYIFEHKDGTVVHCTRLELSQKYSIASSNMSNLINRSSNIKTAKGWKLISAKN